MSADLYTSLFNGFGSAAAGRQMASSVVVCREELRQDPSDDVAWKFGRASPAPTSAWGRGSVEMH
jgi:hypothetical protein